ncbi:MAG: hypothetical protein VKP62_02890 [Candidatus Sericytochromatia bacterium]|nr:hypothetical protein [Candidatus Sericytochromatia bacterium]
MTRPAEPNGRLVKPEQRDPMSQADPHGALYWVDGQPTRRIFPSAVAWMRSVLAHPATRQLVNRGTLVSAQEQVLSDGTLHLTHERVRWISYPHEWPAPMLQDAADTILEVAEQLAEAEMELLDGHPWNVLFQGGRPVFVDWGSFGPASQHLLWTPHQQFERLCLNPLRLFEAGQRDLARARLQDPAWGVNSRQALAFLPATYWLRHPWAAVRLAWQARLEQAAHSEVSPAERPTFSSPHLPRIRQTFLAGVRRELRARRVAPPAAPWLAYYQTCPSMDQSEQATKQALVDQWLARWRPQTLLDVGANAGHFSLLAARRGISVVAVDQDEACLAALYARSRAEGLDLLPLCLDICHPGGGMGWCGTQRAAAWERLRAEAALFLALVHHLVFTHQIALSQLAEMVTALAGRHALFEWVAPDDPMSRGLRATSPRDFSFYTREALVDAFSRAGFEGEWLPPTSPTRQLLHLARR